MHIEKNIIVSLVKTFSDSLEVRQELQARNMMPALHPRMTDEVDKQGNPVYRYAKPTPWVWCPSDLQIVLNP
jgi:hypothetical protein